MGQRGQHPFFMAEAQLEKSFQLKPQMSGPGTKVGASKGYLRHDGTVSLFSKSSIDIKRLVTKVLLDW